MPDLVTLPQLKLRGDDDNYYYGYYYGYYKNICNDVLLFVMLSFACLI